MTNEPNVKLPELPVWTYDYYIDNPNAAGLSSMNLADALCSYARAAIALNTPGVDAQGADVAFTHVCRFSEDYPWELTADGKRKCEKCMPLYAHPAPTGVYAAGKVEALVAAAEKVIKRTGVYGTNAVPSADLDPLRAALAALAEGE